MTVVFYLISGAKRADHRIRGPDAHTKNDFDEYNGINLWNFKTSKDSVLI